MKSCASDRTPVPALQLAGNVSKREADKQDCDPRHDGDPVMAELSG
jgi:hypothetical protein